MNQDNNRSVQSAISELEWLMTIEPAKLPQAVSSYFPKFLTVGRTFLRSFKTLLILDSSDEIIRQLDRYWLPFSTSLRYLREQVEARPTIPLSDLSTNMQQATYPSDVFDVSRSGEPNFPTIVSYISALGNNISDVQELSDRITKFENLSADTEKLLNDLRKYSSELSVEKFAEIFGQQSLKYSRFFQINKPKESSWLNYLKLGSSQIWLGVGILILISPLKWAIDIPTLNDLQNAAALLAFGLKKLFFISLWVFSLRFCFRNYSHYKYLAIQNEHRQNILNSMQLLLQSISSTETAPVATP